MILRSDFSLVNLTKNKQKNNRNSLKKLVAFSSLISLVTSTIVTWPNPINAEVSLSPLLLSVDANRGQAQNVITITNTSDQTFKASIYAEPFTYSLDTGLEILKSHTSDLRPYLHFTPSQVTVPPSGVRRVRLNVSFPPQLPDGEYRAMIFTEPVKDPSPGTSNTTIVTRIGSAFYVRKGSINSLLSVDRATWNLTRKQIQILVKNNGKASDFSTVKWVLMQADKTIAKGETSSHTIVSESQRNIILSISPEDQKLVSVGNYQLSGHLISTNALVKDLPFTLNIFIPPNTAGR